MMKRRETRQPKSHLVSRCIKKNNAEVVVTTHARLNHKPLEAAHPGLNEGQKFLGVAWDYASVKPDIDPALAPTGDELLLEVGDGGSWRDSIQGHIDNGRDTTAGGGTGTCPEALPLGAAGLIEMHMGIDKTR